MPIYSFRNIETGEVHDELLKLAEREPYLANNPHLEQVITAPNFGDSIRMGRQKPDQGFRDILRDIKSKSGAGRNINTFD